MAARESTEKTEKTIECKYCKGEGFKERRNHYFPMSRMNDLTHGRGDKRNYICYHCGAHFWDSKWYSGDEWEDYVNIVDGVDWRVKAREACK